MLTAGHERPALLGAKVFIAAEAVTFAALLIACWRLLAGHAAPPSSHPSLAMGGAMTVALALSSAALARLSRPRWAHLAAGAFGLVFVALVASEWRAGAAARALGASRFADAYYLVGGFHALHIAVGSLVLVALAARGASESQTRVMAWLWHAAVLAWLPIAATFYWPR